MTSSPAIDAAIAAHVAAATAAWPTLVIDERAYVEWLATPPDPDLAARLSAVDPGEVLLCWAAGRGDPEALTLIEGHFLKHIAPALNRFAGDPAFVDEVTQRVRIKLLVKTEGELAPIVNYAFRGSLAGLIRVAAVREALSIRRGDRPAAPPGELEMVAGERDPALRALKLRYAHEFEQSFAAAVAELSARDRHLLRLNLSVKASIDDIARIYQTHRATAARWLNAARDALAQGTRRHLQTRFQLADDELTSLLRLVRTEAGRMLETIPPGADE